MPHKEVFLIAGGSGFLGSRLIPLLLKEVPFCKIIVIDKKKNIYSGKSNSRIKSIYGDLKNASVWSMVPRDITRIFYLAAAIPWKTEDKRKAPVAVNNLLPLARLIEHSQAWKNLKQVIYSSSVSVYTSSDSVLDENAPARPIDIYGASKIAGEKLLSCLESKRVRVACLRYSSIYGRGQYQGTVLPLMVNSALRKNKIYVYGNGNRAQDFLYCDDAANANLLAYKHNAEGVFNIGSGSAVTLTELAGTISNVFTSGLAVLTYTQEKTASRPGYKIDISKAQKVLKYRPYFQIEKGLQKLKEEMGYGK